MLSDDILNEFTDEEIAATKRFQVTLPIVLWYRYIKPMMKRHGYSGKIGQCRFFTDATRHFLAHLAEQENTINSVGLVADAQMDEDLKKALQDVKKN